MGELSGGFQARGALLECFMCFFEFKDDLQVLIDEGYVKITGPETCEWLKSKTSLAEYFKWAFGNTNWVPGGFWAPIENAFGIKRHSLRRLAGKNANELKPEESRDFKKIKPILQRLRNQEEHKHNAQRLFRYIKHLILVEAEGEKPEQIEKALLKIYKLFTKNVDKNVQKFR
jgi:hypothetical protein